MSREKILVVGCGDLGMRLASLIDCSIYEIYGLSRSDRKFADPLIALRGDVHDSVGLKEIITRNFDVILITMTPDEYTEKAYCAAYPQSVAALVSALEAQPGTCAGIPAVPRLVLFVSSTGVYAQSNGEVVNEQSETRPQRFNGRCLLEAENRLLEADVNGCVVRFSGIYGRSNARLIQQVKDGIGCPMTPPQYTNRIHADDCAGVLYHLIELQRNGHDLAPVYVASDCEPAPLWDVKHWLAGQLGLPPEHLVSDDTSPPKNGKQCSSKLLLDSHYTFKYPTYREGYAPYFQVSEENSK